MWKHVKPWTMIEASPLFALAAILAGLTGVRFLRRHCRVIACGIDDPRKVRGRYVA